MIQNKQNFFLGIFIFLIPFLGFPTSWKTTLVILSGLYLVYLSVKIILPKKNIRVKVKKERVAPLITEPVVKINEIQVESNTESTPE